MIPIGGSPKRRSQLDLARRLDILPHHVAAKNIARRHLEPDIYVASLVVILMCPEMKRSGPAGSPDLKAGAKGQ